MRYLSLILVFFSGSIFLFADDQQNKSAEDTTHSHSEYDATATTIHHISDANVLNILNLVQIPLPCIIYEKGHGLKVFMSSVFKPGHHDNGHYAYDGYVLFEGNLHKVEDPSFPLGKVEVESFGHGGHKSVFYQGQEYHILGRSTLDGGMMGGEKHSPFYDFSITKNVLAMILVALLAFWMFSKAARAYGQRNGQAPKGLQSFLEPLFTFIRDEVAIPFIGKGKYLKYLPLLMSLFIFILGLNLFGQIPFFGGINASGNLAVTMVLALVVFFIVNLNGKKDYWQHIFWMPGVPVPLKPLLAFVEVLGLFIKPITLMLRLAGNITAGHIAILSFIGLIFIFGKAGESFGGGIIGTGLSVPLTLFMMSIELIVAFVQAFVFTILTASYIGAAIEEHHHDDHH